MNAHLPARRLWRSDHINETAAQRQDMGRRFAEGYKRLLLQVKGDLPEEWIDLQNRILSYQKELNSLGIRDYQVVGLDHEEVSVLKFSDVVVDSGMARY